MELDLRQFRDGSNGFSDITYNSVDKTWICGDSLGQIYQFSTDIAVPLSEPSSAIACDNPITAIFCDSNDNGCYYATDCSMNCRELPSLERDRDTFLVRRTLDITHIEPYPSHDHVFITSKEPDIDIFNKKTRQIDHRIKTLGVGVKTCAIHPSGKYLAYIDENASVFILSISSPVSSVWETQVLTRISSCVNRKNSRELTAGCQLSWHPFLPLLAIPSTQGSILFVSAPFALSSTSTTPSSSSLSWKEDIIVPPSSVSVTAGNDLSLVAFSPNGLYLLSGDMTGRLHMWEIFSPSISSLPSSFVKSSCRWLASWSLAFPPCHFHWHESNGCGLLTSMNSFLRINLVSLLDSSVNFSPHSSWLSVASASTSTSTATVTTTAAAASDTTSTHTSNSQISKSNDETKEILAVSSSSKKESTNAKTGHKRLQKASKNDEKKEEMNEEKDSDDEGDDIFDQHPEWGMDPSQIPSVQSVTATKVKNSKSTQEVDDDDDDDDDEDNDNNDGDDTLSLPSRRELWKALQILLEEKAKMPSSLSGNSDGLPGTTASMTPSAVALTRPMTPYGSFQPASTLPDEHGRHYLCWNAMGSIISRPDGLGNRIEFRLQESSSFFQPEPFSDLYGFTMAALAKQGAVFASPGKPPSKKKMNATSNSNSYNNNNKTSNARFLSDLYGSSEEDEEDDQEEHENQSTGKDFDKKGSTLYYYAFPRTTSMVQKTKALNFWKDSLPSTLLPQELASASEEQQMLWKYWQTQQLDEEEDILESQESFSFVFPPRERVIGVAVGWGWVAAVSSRGFLRIFSSAGLQIWISRLPGRLISMIGQGRQLALFSTRHQSDGTATTTSPDSSHYNYHHASHGKDHEPSDVVVDLFSIHTHRFPLVHRSVTEFPVPISCPSALTWIGFEVEAPHSLLYLDGHEGLLCQLSCSSFDSPTGHLASSAASYTYQSCHWIPILDVRQANNKRRMGTQWWPVLCKNGQFYYIPLPGVSKPAIYPPPILRSHPLTSLILTSSADRQAQLNSKATTSSESSSSKDVGNGMSMISALDRHRALTTILWKTQETQARLTACLPSSASSAVEDSQSPQEWMMDCLSNGKDAVEVATIMNHKHWKKEWDRMVLSEAQESGQKGKEHLAWDILFRLQTERGWKAALKMSNHFRLAKLSQRVDRELLRIEDRRQRQLELASMSQAAYWNPSSSSATAQGHAEVEQSPAVHSASSRSSKDHLNQESPSIFSQDSSPQQRRIDFEGEPLSGVAFSPSTAAAATATTATTATAGTGTVRTNPFATAAVSSSSSKDMAASPLKRKSGEFYDSLKEMAMESPSKKPVISRQSSFTQAVHQKRNANKTLM